MIVFGKTVRYVAFFGNQGDYDAKDVALLLRGVAAEMDGSRFMENTVLASGRSACFLGFSNTMLHLGLLTTQEEKANRGQGTCVRLGATQRLYKMRETTAVLDQCIKVLRGAPTDTRPPTWADAGETLRQWRATLRELPAAIGMRSQYYMQLGAFFESCGCA